MDKGHFHKKVGIVTGAGTGIGLAIAEQLLAQGACLLINDLQGDRLQANFHSSRGYDPKNIILLEGDAGDIILIRNMIDLVVKQFGRLDFVIANAGLTEFGDFFEFDVEQFRKVMDLNLRGSFFLTQAAARRMRAQGDGGHILLISSVIGQQAYPQLTAYAMSKAALIMMARNLVVELSPYGITINCIAPGATLTPRTVLEDSDYEATWKELIPLARVCYPNDIASAALFLLSPDAAHITGQTLTIDGGWTSVSKFPKSTKP